MYLHSASAAYARLADRLIRRRRRGCVLGAALLATLLTGAPAAAETDSPPADASASSDKEAAEESATVARMRWLVYLGGAWALGGTKGQESISGYEQKSGFGGSVALGIRKMLDPYWDFQVRLSLGYHRFAWEATPCGNPSEPLKYRNCSVSATPTWMPAVDATLRVLPAPESVSFYLGLGARGEAGFHTVEVSGDPIAGGSRMTQKADTTHVGVYGLFETGFLLGTRESADVGLRIAAGVADQGDLKGVGVRIELVCGYGF